MARGDAVAHGAEPPQPAAAWAPVVRNATALGFACPQQYLTALGPFYGSQSEDCLSLNVWAPVVASSSSSSSPTSPLPVLVWIYGGGFVMGSNALPLYDGARLAAGGAVVVSINYRCAVDSPLCRHCRTWCAVMF